MRSALAFVALVAGCTADNSRPDAGSGDLARVLSDQGHDAATVPDLAVPAGCRKDTDCKGDRICVAGACVDPFDLAAAPVGDLATSPDLAASPACVNNGQCAALPHASGTCSAGQCAIAGCDPGYADCNKQAADGCEANIGGDPATCGSCGNACPMGNFCCSGKCADFTGDVKNCGGCGGICPVANNVPACVAGMCAVGKCSDGFANCNGVVGDGCEVDTRSDLKNCGGCGMACAKDAPACTKGVCGCPLGFADCDKNPANGCEVDVITDGKNCGACGNVCQQGYVCIMGACTCPNCQNAFPNAAAGCINGQCVFSGCRIGWANCDGNPQNGCEVQTSGDSKNCGACGVVCPQGNVCAGAACGCRTAADCPTGKACKGGACGSVCDVQSRCNGGCCLNGICSAGTAETACGASGVTCVDCSNNQLGSLCVAGHCGCTDVSQCPMGTAACDPMRQLCNRACSAIVKCPVGCCSAMANGVCLTGAATTACGQDGLCADCTKVGLMCDPVAFACM